MEKLLNSLLKEKEILIKEIERLKQIVEQSNQFVPPGHYFSPIPSIEDIKSNEHLIWGKVSETLPAIDLNITEQLSLLEEFIEYYKEIPFTAKKNNNTRYFFENVAYEYSDAIFLYCFIRKLCPKNIIEVGSGYSSCVMMDTNELFLNNSVNITFIEPYPDLLFSLMREGDREKYEIKPQFLQEIDVGFFNKLDANDILFIDSTHVSKINSDVNYIFFEILPSLNSGVYIHFHDIFYPFEYIKEWVYEGRAWNESYLLRAFLQYNNAFKIVFFNTFLEHFYRDMFEKNMPLCLKNPGGSIWLKKI